MATLLNEGEIVHTESIDSYYESVAKQIVDDVYSKLQAKLAVSLTVYEANANSSKPRSKYLDGMVARYRHLTNYVSFLRNNRAYWRDVFSVLIRKLPHGCVDLHLGSESDKVGEGTDRKLQ